MQMNIMGLYNEYLINRIVDTQIKKYTKHYKKYGSDLDLLSNIQSKIENNCIEKIREKKYTYNEECLQSNNVINLIQSRFDYYFKVNNYYVWLSGNDKFKELLVK